MYLVCSDWVMPYSFSKASREHHHRVENCRNLCTSGPRLKINTEWSCPSGSPALGTLCKTRVRKHSSSLYQHILVRIAPIWNASLITTTSRSTETCVGLTWEELTQSGKVTFVLMSPHLSVEQFFWNHGRCMCLAKEQKDHPECYLCKLQTSACLTVWGCVGAMGNLQTGTYRLWNNNIRCHRAEQSQAAFCCFTTARC